VAHITLRKSAWDEGGLNRAKLEKRLPEQLPRLKLKVGGHSETRATLPLDWVKVAQFWGFVDVLVQLYNSKNRELCSHEAKELWAKWVAKVQADAEEHALALPSKIEDQLKTDYSDGPLKQAFDKAVAEGAGNWDK
jgi:hypothetical protein